MSEQIALTQETRFGGKQKPTSLIGCACAIRPRPSTSFSPEILKRIEDHPCYSEDAHHHYARMHIAVAPVCNIQCNYCNRRYDCANENRPGVTSERLTPEEALDRVSAVLEKVPYTTVVGIAGPGDPLANPDQTFRAFELVRAAYPDVRLCLSTNGLALPDYVDDIEALDIEHVTVTVNAVDPEVGAKVYPWIRYRGKTYRGVEASEILLARQQEGLAALAKRGVLIKTNTVMIPGVNDDHIPQVAKKVHDLGALLINVMPLIPVKGTAFEGMRSPTLAERRAVQEVCEVDLQVMRHCRQCRADAVGLLGEDRSAEFTKEKVAGRGRVTPDLESRRQALKITSEVFDIRRHLRANMALTTASLPEPLLIAVCSSGGGEVNQHFGHAQEFLIYRADERGVRFLEARRVDRYCTGPAECGNERKMDQISQMLSDCRAVLASRFGVGPEYELRAAGIEPIVAFDLIERAMAEALALLQGGGPVL